MKISAEIFSLYRGTLSQNSSSTNKKVGMSLKDEVEIPVTGTPVKLKQVRSREISDMKVWHTPSHGGTQDQKSSIFQRVYISLNPVHFVLTPVHYHNLGGDYSQNSPACVLAVWG